MMDACINLISAVERNVIMTEVSTEFFF